MNRFLGSLNVYKFGLCIHSILYYNLVTSIPPFFFFFLYFSFNGDKALYFLFAICTAKNQYWKLETNIPRKGIAGQQFQTISTFMCLWAIYIFPRLIFLFCCRKYVGRSWGYINRSQNMNVWNGTVAAQFLFWEYLFRIFWYCFLQLWWCRLCSGLSWFWLYSTEHEFSLFPSVKKTREYPPPPSKYRHLPHQWAQPLHINRMNVIRSREEGGECGVY